MPGDISVPHEVDLYLVHLLPNTKYLASVTGAETSGQIQVGEDFTLPDPSIAIIDPATLTIIVAEDNDDDIDGGLDPQVEFTVPVEGDYGLAVTDLTGATGTYNPLVMDPFGSFKNLTSAGDFIYEPTAEQKVELAALPDTNLPPGAV